jgi:putative transposase
MWTQKNRPRYDRDHLRYPSDLTDEEWAVVAPLIPPPRPGGGKRRTDMRAVVNGLMYILSTGCQWRYLPKDFPPHSTVYNYFVWWQCDRVLDRIHHALYVECRERAEREASPTAGKLIKGKKRHILVDIARLRTRLGLARTVIAQRPLPEALR